ncbi:Crp/Fnr family transcriptional regulator [Candidatus Daviesbacteria bacterium]|nr:Crp/Fnr family transcriptional regulator [Candidatus Daviesbacteria bacterium]
MNSMHPKVQTLLLSFFSKYRLKTFARGKQVINPKSKKIFFLTKGAVRMFSALNDNRLTLNIYKPYSLFPMSLILRNIQDKYSYDALSEVEGYFAPKTYFKKFLKNNPDIMLDLLKRIYLGLDGFFQRVEVLLLGDAYLKIITHLIIYSKRFGKNINGKVTFDYSPTHEQLAYQAGLARESVTKEFKKLRDNNLIGYVGKKLFIYDLSKLEEEYAFYLDKTPTVKSWVDSSAKSRKPRF